MKYKDNNILTYLFFILSFFVTILILNRWLVTDLGLKSFGRLWQYYVSYSDFGFIRRGLLGTLISQSSLNSSFSNEYFFAFFFHHISILIFTLSILYYCFKKKIKNSIFIFGVAFAPTLIIYQGYNTGNLDIIVLLIALVNILYVKNYIVFALNVVIGLFIHELFFFTLPAQFFVFYFCNKSESLEKINLRNTIPLTSTILALVVILIFGKLTISETEFKNIMQLKMPNAYMMHSLWSGHYEISASLERNLKSSILTFLSNFKNGKIIYLFPVFLYLIFLILRTLNYFSSKFKKFLFVSVSFFPIFISLVAWDYPRWFALSANMTIFITLKLADSEYISNSNFNKIIAIFCLFAPFGTVAIDQPLPLHQFIFHKIIS